jgi:glycosyltransferase involved in cell wall biosynthesis
MEKVLFITHRLRPNNNAEALQSTMIAKYLSRHCETHVISTTQNPTDLGASIHHHVQAKSASSLGAQIERLFSKFGKNIRFTFPDPHARWIEEAVINASALIKENQIKTVITRSMPASTHLIGLNLKSKYADIRWIASMSDPISINPYQQYSSQKLKIRMVGFEKRIFNLADIVTHTNHFVIEEYRRIYPDMGRKHIVLSNMFDRQDVPWSRFIKSGDGPMVISYAGRLYGRRSLEPLFQAARNLIESDKNSIMIINLIGPGKSRKLDRLIAKHGLANVIRILPFMDSQKLAQVLQSSHLLVTIDGDFPGESIFLPSKNMDYLSMTVPMLGITRKGPTAALIEETKSGFWAEPEDADDISKFLQQHRARIIRGYEFVPDHEKVMNYHCNNTIAQFILHISIVCGNH